MIRHGEITSNVNKVYAGKTPERLTEKGVYQAKEVTEKLKGVKVHALYSSPIQRARQTAEIIGEKIGKDVLVNEKFRELELGPWECLSEKTVARMYPEEWRIWQNMPAELKLPGRETLDELMDRVLTGVRDVYCDIADYNVVIVTHVAIIRVLLLWHAQKRLNLYKSIHVPNAEIFELKIDTSSKI